MTQFSFEAIGTHWSIDVYDIGSAAQSSELETLLRARIEEFEQTYSRFRADSWLSHISHTPGTYELKADGWKLFNAYHSIYRATGGSVTPLIGQTLIDAGYDAEYSFVQHKELQPPITWDTAIELHPKSITIKQSVALDLGALGKGYIIDLVCEYLEEQGVDSYCIDAGGDMRAKLPAPHRGLRVGLEDPEDQSSVLGVYTLKNKSMAGSSGNRRRWQTTKREYTHIINPETGISPTHIAAVWVIADSALLADTLTTALYFSKPEDLLKTYTFSYIILNSDRTIDSNMLHDPMLELFI